MVKNPRVKKIKISSSIKAGQAINLSEPGLMLSIFTLAICNTGCRPLVSAVCRTPRLHAVLEDINFVEYTILV
jgi:hypothetical protein